MAYADTTRKNSTQTTAAGSLNITLNSTVAGNLVIVAASLFNNASDGMTTSTCVDGSGNTYTNSFRALASSGTQRQGTQLFTSVLGTGGNLTITVDPGANTYDFFLAVQEFSGPNSSPASGTPVTATGTTETTADTTAFTPADADCLYVAVDGNSATGAITENVAPGDTDWTFSNELEDGALGEPGSLVWFIRSGAAVARRSAWTIPTGTFWAAGIAGFKPAAAAAAFTQIPILARFP